MLCAGLTTQSLLCAGLTGLTAPVPPHLARSQSAGGSNLSVAMPASPSPQCSASPPPVPPVLRSMSMPNTEPLIPGLAAASLNSQTHSMPASPLLEDGGGDKGEEPHDECTVCCERSVNCVLYMCGHMCMCFDCAIAVKHNKGGLCPICRQPIKDVIKTYRS